MKKTTLLFAIASLAFSACKKSSTPDEQVVDPFKLEYSNLDTTAQKQNLEKAGVDFVKKIESLSDEKFIDVLDYLATFPSVNGGSIFTSVSKISSASKNKDLKAIFSTVSAVDSVSKLSEHYGIYIYNRASDTWVKTASTTKLEFRFPATENSTTNNAILTCSYVASSVKVDVEGERAELPASITAALIVDNKEELKLTSNYQYKSDGTPTKTETTLVLGAFTLKTSSSNNSSDFGSSLSISKGSETLLSFSAGASGTLSVDGATNMDDPNEIVKNANASFEIMNIKLAGQVDFKGLNTANKLIDYNQEDSITVKKEVENLNKFSKVVAINKDNNTVIAKLVFKPVTESSTWCYYDYGTQQNICDTYTNSYAEPRLVFKDGTPLAFDTFFDNGFGKLIDELEDLNEKL